MLGSFNQCLSKFTGVQKARALLGIELPVPRDVLKSAYRIQCRLLHPDSNPNAKPADFIAMDQFYKALVDLDPDWAFTDTNTKLARTTETGFPLASLGLGLGPFKNGKDCPLCGHKGYTERQADEWQPCSNCSGTGLTRKCFDCKGTGKFTLRSKREVACRRCYGTGNSHSRFCYPCAGAGRVRVTAVKINYAICGHCNGTGELEIFNPVIPKNRL